MAGENINQDQRRRHTGARLTGLISGLYGLKEYYEIVSEARPLSGIFPTYADFFTEMHF